MASRPAPTKKSPAKTAAVAATPKAPAPKTKTVAAPVVTLKAVFEQLGMAQGLSKQQTHGLLANLVATMTDHLKQGNRIRMSGLGILEVKTRAARTGRNPATDESIQINASKKVAFRPAKDLSKRFRKTAAVDPANPRPRPPPRGFETAVERGN